MKIPESVTVLGSSAFQGCTSLTEVTVPSKIKSLKSFVFNLCQNLTTVNLPEGLTTIGTAAFSSCFSLKSLKIPSTVNSIYSIAFWRAGLETLNLPDSINFIGNGAFEVCSLTKAELPEGLEYVGDMVFENNKLSGAVSVPNSVKRIGAYAYAFNNNMTSFICGTGLKRIERLGICASEKLATVTLNEGLEFIGEQALCNLAITEITIPSTVDTVEKGAFENNPLIGDFYLRPAVPPVTTGDIVLPNTQFNGIIIHPYQESTLHVPVGAVEAYRNAPIWGKFTEIVGDINAVGEITLDNAEIKEIYDLEGRRLPAIQPGKINICIMTDGTVRKIMAPVSE